MTMIDMSEVDVILLSNFHNVLALPYITEFTDFQGIVYATEPTMHLGRYVNGNLLNDHKKTQFFFLKKFLEDISPFYGATDTPILDTL